eukprot:scaffold32685_cov43-Prasinocladus_malaysianus.AAC.2
MVAVPGTRSGALSHTCCSPKTSKVGIFNTKLLRMLFGTYRGHQIKAEFGASGNFDSLGFHSVQEQNVY